MILFGHVIDGIDSELNNSEENIFGIGSRSVMVFILGIKYYWGIKGNNIKIYILSLI